MGSDRGQDDLRDQKETAADKNDELHAKLEMMVEEVAEVVGDRRQPERSSSELEADKL